MRKELLRSISSDSDQTEDSCFSFFDSEASRIDFWKDINTKDSDYTNAVILSKNTQQIRGNQGKLWQDNNAGGQMAGQT